MSSIEIRILFFASAREKMGCSSVHMTLAESACLGDLIHMLYQQHPQLNVLQPYVRWAINQRFEDDEHHILRQGDEVALIPPISGG